MCWSVVDKFLMITIMNNSTSLWFFVYTWKNECLPHQDIHICWGKVVMAYKTSFLGYFCDTFLYFMSNMSTIL
jgi:hypothetical protein